MSHGVTSSSNRGADRACVKRVDPAPGFGVPCHVAKILTLVWLALLVSTARADDHPTLVDAECDPFPFATGRYGCQIGIRPNAFRGVRVSVAQFSIVVPDAIAQINNAGFHEDVRPGSGALYVLYYLGLPGADGVALGGSLRYLRERYTHDDVPGQHADVVEWSPEVIVGYQWHPLHNGLYLQPWLALGVVLSRRGEPVVGAHHYDELPISPFFTVNIGYEHAL
jgi:hypothetical protein